MDILHVEKGDPTSIDLFNRFFASDSRHLFVLVHMNGCPPCIATLPEWKKMGERLKYRGNASKIPIIVADINADVVNSNAQIANHIKSIDGYPTIRYYKNSEFEANDADRDVDGLMRWVESKTQTNTAIVSASNLFDQIKQATPRPKARRRRTHKASRKTAKRRRRGLLHKSTRKRKQKQKYKR